MDIKVKNFIDGLPIEILSEIAEYCQAKFLESLKKGDAIHVAHRASWVGWDCTFQGRNIRKGTVLVGYMRKEAGAQSQNVDDAYIRAGNYPKEG